MRHFFLVFADVALLIISTAEEHKNPQSELLYNETDGFSWRLGAGAKLIAFEFEVEATAGETELASGARDVAAMLA